MFFRRLHTVRSQIAVCKLVLLFRRLTNSLASRLDENVIGDEVDLEEEEEDVIEDDVMEASTRRSARLACPRDEHAPARKQVRQ